MKTGADFKEQTEKNNITRWDIHKCSMCSYQCSYHFIDGNVFYDNGCDCTSGQNLNPRSWDDVAEQYNIQSYPKVIKKMNEFWGFKNVEMATE